MNQRFRVADGVASRIVIGAQHGDALVHQQILAVGTGIHVDGATGSHCVDGGLDRRKLVITNCGTIKTGAPSSVIRRRNPVVPVIDKVSIGAVRVAGPAVVDEDDTWRRASRDTYEHDIVAVGATVVEDLEQLTVDGERRAIWLTQECSPNGVGRIIVDDANRLPICRNNGAAGGAQRCATEAYGAIYDQLVKLGAGCEAVDF